MISSQGDENDIIVIINRIQKYNVKILIMLFTYLNFIKSTKPKEFPEFIFYLFLFILEIKMAKNCFL